jgi:hypothetical protein
MDVRAYYQKIRKIEGDIPEPYVVVVSRETPDGGKPGVKTDVPRSLAAKLIVEDQAALASPEEAAQFRAEEEGRRQEALSLETAGAEIKPKRQGAKRKNQRQ